MNSLLRAPLAIGWLASRSPSLRIGQNVLFIAIDDLDDWVGPPRGHPQVKARLWTGWRDAAWCSLTPIVPRRCAIPRARPSSADVNRGRRA